MAKLTDKAVENQKPGPKRKEVPDAAMPGLYLLVQPSGAKSWAYRYRFGRKTRKLTLGRYPKVGLAGARKAFERSRASKENKRRRVLKPHELRADRRGSGGDRRPASAGELRLTKSRGEVLSKWKDRNVQDITSEDVIQLIDAIAARGARIAANHWWQ